jgi:hypothetical protein
MGCCSSSVARAVKAQEAAEERAAGERGSIIYAADFKVGVDIPNGVVIRDGIVQVNAELKALNLTATGSFRVCAGGYAIETNRGSLFLSFRALEETTVMTVYLATNDPDRAPPPY